MYLNWIIFSWANYLASIGVENIQYSINETTGENIAWSSTGITGSQATTKWYNEINNYSFDKPGYSSEIG